ncbi:O-antigen ligase domain-containing protein [Polaribacter sp. WD7]|uniref:O-antigen ligase family protein n=1 Tax=Polaribacter sp. WD7 TaxID=2269061 RepID=UPI000DF134EC|nr:O-antigen ligase family protein [Polaribacter sp. WD7]RCS27696.1 O-antigen ligase domain-containing protein [Polaribacter sp. WD7]
MKLKQNSIVVISFFVFSGYYALLALLIALGLTDSTRLVTIPLRMITTILMLYVLIFEFKSIQNNKKNPIYLLFILFWSLYFIKVLINESNLYVLNRRWYEYLFYAVNFCILPFLMFSKISFNQYKRKILSSLIFSGFLMGLTSLYLYKAIILAGVGRISMARYSGIEDETLSPIALSYAGALTLTLCFYELVFNKNKKITYSIYLYITIILSLLMFFLGSSRGSIVAIVMSLPLFIIYGGAKNKLKFIVSFILSIPIIIYGANKTGTSVFERTSNTLESGDFGRGNLWVDAWNEFLNNPILGGRIEIGFYPHNFILETLMATGIIGVVLLFFLLFKGFKNVYLKSFKDPNYIWVFIILIQGFVQHTFSGALYFSVVLFFSLGLSFSQLKQNE